MQAGNNIGLGTASELTDPKTIRYINLKLALLGFPAVAASSDPEFDELTAALLQRQHETDRLLADPAFRDALTNEARRMGFI